MQLAYDRIASQYARRNDEEMPAAILQLARRLVARVARASHLIDVGCGTGRDMAWFESQGLAVTGIDLSNQMLTHARPIVRGALFNMNMCQLGLRNATFDAAWCCASLLHVPKHESASALGEIRRVLKPGGPMILTLQKRSSEIDGESWEDSDSPGVRRFFARHSVGEATNLLAGSGFDVDAIEEYRGSERDWLFCTCIA
jgi:ubiquinone/menaquinone biosynthesis C-methylase UbiE